MANKQFCWLFNKFQKGTHLCGWGCDLDKLLSGMWLTAPDCQFKLIMQIVTLDPLLHFEKHTHLAILAREGLASLD